MMGNAAGYADVSPRPTAGRQEGKHRGGGGGGGGGRTMRESTGEAVEMLALVV